MFGVLPTVCFISYRGWMIEIEMGQKYSRASKSATYTLLHIWSIILDSSVMVIPSTAHNISSVYHEFLLYSCVIIHNLHILRMKENTWQFTLNLCFLIMILLVFALLNMQLQLRTTPSSCVFLPFVIMMIDISYIFYCKQTRYLHV